MVWLYIKSTLMRFAACLMVSQALYLELVVKHSGWLERTMVKTKYGSFLGAIYLGVVALRDSKILFSFSPFKFSFSTLSSFNP